VELIRGIIAAPVLPMTEEFEVDWAGLPDYLRWLALQRPTTSAMSMHATEGPRSPSRSASA
jgi:dihydrodipicolinate synthase/N-acetylneuraminate lyase